MSTLRQFFGRVRLQWRGNLPDSDQLSPTSKAMVAVIDILVGIGGGGIVDDELLAGKAQGKPIYFYPAEIITRGQPTMQKEWECHHQNLFGGQMLM